MDKHSSDINKGFDTNRGIGRLHFTLHTALLEATDSLITAPTSLGKTHKVATTRWREKTSLTGGEPVIHVSQSKKAREYAAGLSDQTEGVNAKVLKGREDACPVAKGDFDDEYLVPVDRVTPSEWLNRRCDVEGVPFSLAHEQLSDLLSGLPCSQGTQCEGVSQWEEIFRNGSTKFDVIHVTQPFLFNSALVDGANIIFDEEPSFVTRVEDEIRKEKQIGRTVTREHIRGAVNECFDNLYQVDYRWADLVVAVRTGDKNTQNAIRDTLNKPKDTTDWVLRADEVDTLAPAIIRAILNSVDIGNKRRRGTSQFTPTEVGLHEQAATDISVVIDDRDGLKLIHHPPDLSTARCVIGLDAHPTERLWRLNTGVDFSVETLLDDDENKRWKQFQRGLVVYQVGPYTRQYTTGWAGDDQTQRLRTKRKAKALVRATRQKHGEGFRTAITAKSITSDVEKMMAEVGVSDPEVWHYGGIKSRDDFGQEPVGLLVGCIDPGDHSILDTLALLGLEAEPERFENDDGEVIRAPGRGFVGPDANAAEDLLKAVRERNVAQAIGRYARDSNDDSTAIVYVWTDAIPEWMIDAEVPGVEDILIGKQRRIVNLVQQAGRRMTAKEVMEELEDLGQEVSKTHVQNTLEEMVDRGVAEVREGGYNGAFEYFIERDAVTDLVDLEPQSPTNLLTR